MLLRELFTEDYSKRHTDELKESHDELSDLLLLEPVMAFVKANFPFWAHCFDEKVETFDEHCNSAHPVQYDTDRVNAINSFVVLLQFSLRC